MAKASFKVLKQITRLSEGLKKYQVGDSITPKNAKDKEYLISIGVIKAQTKKAPESRKGNLETK